jgi:hypothetical protein
LVKKLIPLFILVFLSMSWISVQAQNAPQYAAGSASKPVITQGYAAAEMRAGDVWKVYINASDPNSDLKYVVATIDQPGRGGGYPPSYTRIKGGNVRGLSGYVYLNTVVNVQQGLNFTNITLTVQVKDKAGNFSNPVSFPLHFQMNARQEPPASGLFQEKDLGPGMIQIRPLGDG